MRVCPFRHCPFIQGHARCCPPPPLPAPALIITVGTADQFLMLAARQRFHSPFVIVPWRLFPKIHVSHFSTSYY